MLSSTPSAARHQLTDTASDVTHGVSGAWRRPFGHVLDREPHREAMSGAARPE
jgi:hypothetical protein